MRTKFFSLTLTALLALLAVPADAQDARMDEAFSVGATVVTTNLAYVVTPARGGVAHVQFLSTKSASASGALTFYTASAPIVITNALAAGLSNILATGVVGTLAANDVIVIRNVANDTYQRCLVHLTNSSGILITNPVAAVTTSFALSKGDQIFKMTSAGAFTVGSTLTTWGITGQGGIWNSQANKPALIDIADSGATANSSLIVSGILSPR